jgi:hypothetical protein
MCIKWAFVCDFLYIPSTNYYFSPCSIRHVMLKFCLMVLRKALMNATLNPSSKMEPYIYYTLKYLVNLATNESYS